MENLEAYSGELKALFGFVKYQKDKAALGRFVTENEEVFKTLTAETVRAISVLGNVRELKGYLEDKENDEEEINMCEALQEMIMDGRTEGKAEGKAEDVLELLEDLGEVSEALRQQIMAQRDIDIFRKWHKLAAKADTVQEFVNGMS